MSATSTINNKVVPRCHNTGTQILYKYVQDDYRNKLMSCDYINLCLTFSNFNIDVLCVDVRRKKMQVQCVEIKHLKSVCVLILIVTFVT